jgi:multiple antibiotic resistance protein
MNWGELINAFVVLFVVLDPLGVAVLFGALAHEVPESSRRHMARKGVLLAAGILLVFACTGTYLLDALGISLPAFKIAGGLLLFLLAIDMVFARHSGLRSTTHHEQREAQDRQDLSVFPLAFPLIAGPGAMTTILLLLGSGKGGSVYFIGIIALLALVLLLTYWSLLATASITRLLGATGINVIDRLLGVILSALAVQYVIDGIHASFRL